MGDAIPGQQPPAVIQGIDQRRYRGKSGPWMPGKGDGGCLAIPFPGQGDALGQQGLVTQAICTQTAREEAQVIQANLEAHAADTGAHSALFGQKANTSHKHGAADVQSGTFTGIVAAMASTAYTTAQVRNIVLNTTEPSGGSNGLVWIKYTA